MPGTSGGEAVDLEPSKHSDAATDSDATRLNSDIDGGISSPTSSSEESEYELDPDYEGPMPQGQPGQKRGVSYCPAGMRKVYRKVKRKLLYPECLRT